MLDQLATFLLDQLPPDERDRLADGEAFLEALAAGLPADEVAERDGAGVKPARELARLAAGRHRALLKWLPRYASDADTTLRLAEALAQHMAAYQDAVLAATEAAAKERRSGFWHDLRSPVGAIFGALDVVNATLGPEAAQARPMLGIVENGAERILALVERYQQLDEPAQPLAVVCEPDSAIFDMLRLYLDQAGFEVVRCASGDAAAAVVTRAPALFVLEGGELARYREAWHGAAPTPVIAVGGLEPAADADAWLPKPFKRAEFQAALAKAHPEGQEGAPA